VIQAASAVAVQAHSGCVVTVIAAAPPPASIEPGAAPSDTAHFGADGPVTDSVDVDPHAEAHRAAVRIEATCERDARKRRRERPTMGRSKLSKLHATAVIVRIACYARLACRVRVWNHGRYVSNSIRAQRLRHGHRNMLPALCPADGRLLCPSMALTPRKNLVYRLLRAA
jgi:hypothetical protein